MVALGVRLLSSGGREPLPTRLLKKTCCDAAHLSVENGSRVLFQ
jgi:hypothetical protein